MKKTPKLGIIVPCYNEEEGIEITLKSLSAVINTLIDKKILDSESFIGLVDDGSKDNTWVLIEEKQKVNSKIKGLKLAGNVGHQNALLAGLLHFHEYSDILISIDADLQDDVSVIETMIEKYNQGFEIVYGVRKKRNKDSFFKKYTALCFYKMMIFLGVNVVYNHADFRLTSKKVIESLNNFKEESLFLRGIFPLMGYSSTNVYYDRLKRLTGNSKYPFSKMMQFALNGVTSFSVKPLRLVTILGMVVFLVSLVLSVYTLYSKFFLNVVPGWASIVLPIYLLGGIQVLSVGILGEYIGNIYKEVKHRPRYIIEKVI